MKKVHTNTRPIKVIKPHEIVCKPPTPEPKPLNNAQIVETRQLWVNQIPEVITKAQALTLLGG